MNRLQYAGLLIGLMLILPGMASLLHAQVKLQTGDLARATPAIRPLPQFATQPSLFPKYIQQNPMGYASLCRMELKIEKNLPVGIWMRADGATYRQVSNPGLAYLRLKIPIAGSR